MNKTLAIIAISISAVSVVGGLITGTVKIKHKQKKLEEDISNMKGAFRMVKYHLDMTKPIPGMEMTKEELESKCICAMVGLRGALGMYDFSEEEKK